MGGQRVCGRVCVGDLPKLAGLYFLFPAAFVQIAESHFSFDFFLTQVSQTKNIF